LKQKHTQELRERKEFIKKTLLSILYFGLFLGVVLSDLLDMGDDALIQIVSTIFRVSFLLRQPNQMLSILLQSPENTITDYVFGFSLFTTIAFRKI
jgi:hypothetical protein